MNQDDYVPNIISFLSCEARNVYKVRENREGGQVQERQALSVQLKKEIIKSVADTLRQFLDIANELLDTKELTKLYRFDGVKKEAEIFSEAQNYEILLYKELLRHKATDRFLDNQMSNMPHHSSNPKFRYIFRENMVVAFLAGLFYPVLSVLSVFWKNLRYTIFVYPISYFTIWASYFYITVLLYKHNYYFLGVHTHEVDDSTYRYSSALTTTHIILWILIVGKIKDEFDDFYDNPTSGLTIFRKSLIYFFDKWNYIDFFSLIFILCYRVILD